MRISTVIMVLSGLVLPLAISTVIAQNSQSSADSDAKTHVEAGVVQWRRDLPAALKQAKQSGKPVFLQFQEIPGCQTCQNYGNGPLSHYLLVQAIEDLFIPVLIHNNKQGIDAEVLKKFGEKSWNNPVVRYVNASAKDLIARKENIWTVQGTAVRMIAALKANQSEVPGYLQTVATAPAKTETAIFAMHCYWEGEAHLGGLAGVQNTRSAWIGKKEVVEVEYDPSQIDYESLIRQAQKMKCASTIFATNEKQQQTANQLSKSNTVRMKDGDKTRVAKMSDQKYYLRNSNYRHLPLTMVQSTKINAMLMDKKNHGNIANWLSPRQAKLLKQISQTKKTSAKAFDDFVFPEDDSKLADYEARLFDKLTKLQKK